MKTHPTTHQSIIDTYLKVGDTLTHTRCAGCIEEHIYTGRDGAWLCGTPTRDTLRLEGSRRSVNDISANNVTHINRVPVEAVPYLAVHSHASSGNGVLDIY